MLKNKKSFICAVVFIILTLMSSFCFAEDTSAEDTNQANEPVTTNQEESLENGGDSSQLAIHEDDLFLCGATITMDQLVSGNVYIIANDVTVTGQVAGNMYILANKVTFSQGYVQSSAYITANTIKFEGIATDLYANCVTLDIPANYGVYRDLKVNAQTTYLSGAVGRNAYITSSKLALEKDGAKATIFGNLNYTSSTEINIPEGAVEGEVSYSPSSTSSLTTSQKVQKYVIAFVSAFVTALAIYLLSIFFADKVAKRAASSLANTYGLPVLGIGLASFILIPIAALILLVTIIGMPAALLLLGFYALLLFISIPVITVLLTKVLSEHFKIEKKFAQIAILFLVSIVISAIGYIPFVGGILRFILLLAGFGSLFTTLFIPKFGTKKIEKKEKTAKEKKKED